MRSEAALVGELMRAHQKHAEVAVDLKGIRGYVVDVSPTGAKATIWDGESEIEVPVSSLKDVRGPVEEDGPKVHAPARKVKKGQGDQTSIEFGPEQLGMLF